MYVWRKVREFTLNIHSVAKNCGSSALASLFDIPSSEGLQLLGQSKKVFREYYLVKEEDSIVLECIWHRYKYVLVERKHKYEANSQERDVMADVPLTASKIQYENIEVLIGGCC